MDNYEGPVIAVKGLRKRFAGHACLTVALDGLNLVVGDRPGRVHGFLGPNGSGKTTTLRILTGLIRADKGSVLLFGRPVPEQLPHVLRQVGVLVEAPTLFGAFSGKLNLSLLAESIGISARTVDSCLDRVGLLDRAKDPVRTYSLGVRQRLGIAIALLKEPALLILDEPTNGLDPEGIQQTRGVIQSLAAEGVTVLLSSHLLSEVGRLCDDVTIVSRGRTLDAGPLTEVIARYAAPRLHVALDPREIGEALALLTRRGIIATLTDGGVQIQGVIHPRDVTRILAEGGVYLTGLVKVQGDLESAFFAVTASSPMPATSGSRGSGSR